MNKWLVGDVEITRIEELLGPAALAREFFRDYSDEEFKPHQQWLAPNFYEPASGKLVASIHSWLLRTNKHVILIDTCCGNHKPRPGMPRYHMLDVPYLSRLKAANVEPEEVDFVLCTHLHVDHVGWNTRLHNGRWIPTFPKAKYVMSRLEHEFWSRESRQPDTPEGIKNVYNDSVLPVVEAGQALLCEDTYALNDLLTVRAAPGHTPGHVRIDLRSRGETAIFCGDAIHNPVQVALCHWNTVFCTDLDQARQTRHDLLAHCVETGALLMPIHFGTPHVATIKSKNGQFSPDFSTPR